MYKVVIKSLILVGLIVFLFQDEQEVLAEKSNSFIDVSDRYEESINYFYASNVIKGVSSTEFGVQEKLKRGDAAVILANVLGLDPNSAPNTGFQDVNSRIEGHVNALVDANVLSGISNTVFDPNSYLTRGQMAKILVNAYKLHEYAKDTPYTDLTSPFKQHIESLYGAEVTKGVSNDNYGTKVQIKRGDFVILLYKTINFSQKTTIKSVASFEQINTDIGGSIEDLSLPKIVKVTYLDGGTADIPVKWDLSGLNLEYPAEYTIPGEIKNTEIKASIKVKVHDVQIENVEDIVLAKGTKVGNLQLPKHLMITYQDGRKINKLVSWDLSNLNLRKPGIYYISGLLEGIPK